MVGYSFNLAVVLGQTVSQAFEAALKEIAIMADDEDDDVMADNVREYLVEVVSQLREVKAMAGKSPKEAIAKFGKNCHLPNSYTTPLHCALFSLSVCCTR